MSCTPEKLTRMRGMPSFDSPGLTYKLPVSARTGASPVALKPIGHARSHIKLDEVSDWRASLRSESGSFNSLAIYGEIRLREAFILQRGDDSATAPRLSMCTCVASSKNLLALLCWLSS